MKLSEVQEALNQVSPSFCAAKWYRTTLWLNTGQTASCHLPPSHAVNRQSVKRDPRTLLNTQEKLVARAQMLKGQRPSECAACWVAEDAGAVSERTIKSRAFSQMDLQLIARAPDDWLVSPTHLEIAFSNRCNFACSYCNAEFSSRWQSELREKTYRGLKTSGSETYQQYKKIPQDSDPFLAEAFWKNWNRLKKDLRELRITGGEPLLSNEFWYFLEHVARDKAPFQIAINTNLGAPEALIERLVKLSSKLPHVELYTSCEGVGASAEYLRDGLDFQVWRENLLRCRDSGAFQLVTVMSTINALSGFSLVDLFTNLRQERALTAHCRLDINPNWLRFPEFQSLAVLPQDLRVQLADQYLVLLRSEPLHDIEAVALERFVAQLMQAEVTESHRENLCHDFFHFFSQYDQRRSRSMLASASHELHPWLRGLGFAEPTESIPL